MRRYEVSDGQSHKFWEITLHGAGFTVRFGRMGSEGQRRSKEFDDPQQAQQEWERLIAQKIQGGYRLVHADGPDAADVITAVQEQRNPDLERTIEQDPDADAPFLLYADWLQDHHDPRGELICLQHALASEKDPARFLSYRQAEQALLQRHAPQFYGERLQQHYHLLRVQWRLGFFGAVTINIPQVVESGVTVADVLSALFEAASARMLLELRVEPGDQSLQDHGVVEQLVRDPHPRALPRDARSAPLSGEAPPLRVLRRLTLGDPKLRPATELGDLSRLWDACPHLTELRLCGKSVEPGPVHRLEQLRTLEVRSASGQVMRALAKGTWPALRRLALSFDGQGPTDLIPTLEGMRLLALNQLALRGLAVSTADALCQELAASGLASRLELLDLTDSKVTDAGAAALVQHAARFSALKRLVLEGTVLSRRTGHKLEALWADVRLPAFRVTRHVEASGEEWEEDAPAAEETEGEVDDERYDETME